MKLYNDFKMFYVESLDEEYDINYDEMVFLLGGLGNEEFKSIPPTEEIKNKLLNKKLIIEDINQMYGVTYNKEGVKLAISFYNRLTQYPNRLFIRKFIMKGRSKHELSIGRLSTLSNVNYNRIQTMESLRESGYIHINDLKNVCKILTPNLSFDTIIRNLKKYEIFKKKVFENLKEQKNMKKEVTKNIEPKEQILKSEEETELLKFKCKILKIESPIEYSLIKELIKFDEKNIFDMNTQINYSINGRNYRAEIIITFINNLNKLSHILVECDGHEFHEKTKEQVQKDKQRDRDFLSIGIPTLRFSGSEIHKDALSCAKEVFDTYKSYAKTVS